MSALDAVREAERLAQLIGQKVCVMYRGTRLYTLSLAEVQRQNLGPFRLETINP